MKVSLTSISILALSASIATAETTISYMSWSPDQLELEMPVIAEFEAANPGVTVEVQAMPPSDYWPKLSALAAAGDLPDVFMMSSGFVDSWGLAGNLADLAPLAEGTDLGAYFEGSLTPGMVNGTMVAFPQNWVAPVLYYNKDMFDAAGLDYPDADMTWDEFRAAAKALTTEDVFGYWVYGRYAHVDTWVYRNGGRYLTDDKSGIELNAAAVNTLQFLSDLIAVDNVAPQPQEMEGIRQQDVFPLGMAAMWVDGSWNIDNVRNVADPSMNWGIAQVPMGPDATADTAAAYAWADMLSVSETSENKDLAWDFIQTLVGGERSAADFPGGKVPAYRAIAESDEWLERGSQPANKELILEIGAQTVYSGFSENWSTWRGYGAEGQAGLNGELDEVFNGRKSLDDAIAAFTAYGNEVLAR
ncbi:MAG: sugar ABC transporter substrate-binding protein [Pseudomonadota bacterium]